MERLIAYHKRDISKIPLGKWGKKVMNFKWLLSLGFLMLFLSPQVHAQMQVLSGSYTGNGIDNTAITGLGFQPDVVIIKGDINRDAYCRTSTMAGDSTKTLGSALALQANLIQSLNIDGFTIGNHTGVGSSTVDYHWVAFKAAAGEMALGSYTGNGTTQDIAVGFQPDYIIVMAETAQLAVHRSSALPGTINGGNLTTNRSYVFSGHFSFTGGITAILSTGFRVGSSGRVNSASNKYHYIAWKEIPGTMDVGAYAGDGNDNRNITGVGFEPEWVIVKSNYSSGGGNTEPNSNNAGTHHSQSLGAATDKSLVFTGFASFTNGIQALLPDGFQVGNHERVNKSEIERWYFYAAFGASGGSTAISLLSFNAEIKGFQDEVVLSWETATEVDNAGFNIYRSRLLDGVYKKVNDVLISAKGDATTGASYEYIDRPGRGTFYYKLEDVDYHGVSTMHGSEQVRVRARK